MRFSFWEGEFRSVWRRLATEGACDCIDGAEYQRVFGEWQDAGCPRQIWRFIRRRANIDSEGREPGIDLSKPPE